MFGIVFFFSSALNFKSNYECITTTGAQKRAIGFIFIHLMHVFMNIRFIVGRLKYICKQNKKFCAPAQWQRQKRSREKCPKIAALALESIENPIDWNVQSRYDGFNFNVWLLLLLLPVIDILKRYFSDINLSSSIEVGLSVDSIVVFIPKRIYWVNDTQQSPSSLSSSMTTTMDFDETTMRQCELRRLIVYSLTKNKAWKQKRERESERE